MADPVSDCEAGTPPHVRIASFLSQAAIVSPGSFFKRDALIKMAFGSEPTEDDFRATICKASILIEEGSGIAEDKRGLRVTKTPKWVQRKKKA